MADSTLFLFPRDPMVLPTAAAESHALSLLHERFAVVGTERHDTPVFVDAGQSFESLSCPACGMPLSTKWWGQQMDAANVNGFIELGVSLPCCGAASSLNDLDYDAPQGFARFLIVVRRPDRDLEQAERDELESRLGLPIRTVWSRI